MAADAPPILTRIVQARRAAVDRAKANLPRTRLEELAEDSRAPRDFRAAVTGRGVALIAECKQKSPSGGLLRPQYDPVDLARRYAANGAAAISVLTEPEFFGGSAEHLRMVCSAVDVPVLCKDFVIDGYQVLSARAIGADAVLLIVALLEDEELKELQEEAQKRGLQAIVEVHTEAEVERALLSSATMIGINNRDLFRMETDTSTTARLRACIPKDRTVISESGISTRADVEAVRALGIDAILVGEALLRADDLDAKVRELAGI